MPPTVTVPPLLRMPRSSHVCSIGVLFVVWDVSASGRTAPWQGISYGVSPDDGLVVSDDMFNGPTREQWGCPGRGDLHLMAQMGANMVRLYGNDPRWDHASFLDEAAALGLGVVPGISDWPYIQSQDYCSHWMETPEDKEFENKSLSALQSRAKTGGQLNDCHDSIMNSYLGNLQNGFVRDGKYHPGLKALIAINEPDLKLSAKPLFWAKAVVSAIDGMLSAEEHANLTNPDLPITVTMSFAICSDCEFFTEKPGLAQMAVLRDAMRHPAKYGYKPRHNLSAFYDRRFINSFNTGNPAFEIEKMFLDDYSSPEGFPGVPVFIAEYHCPSEPVHEDLMSIMKIASTSKELLGVSFFEWVNRHDEGGHTDWGIFDLIEPNITQMDYNGTIYNIRSLNASEDSAGDNIAFSVAKAYGGKHVQASSCEGQCHYTNIPGAGCALGGSRFFSHVRATSAPNASLDRPDA